MKLFISFSSFLFSKKFFSGKSSLCAENFFRTADGKFLPSVLTPKNKAFRQGRSPLFGIGFGFSVAKEATINTPFRTEKTAPHFYAIGILHEKPLTIKSGVPCIRTNASSKAPSALSFRAKGQSREFGQTFLCITVFLEKNAVSSPGRTLLGKKKGRKIPLLIQLWLF
ncbi:MAG: hypothetical protein IJ945_04645 [Oscillospiraceae bacterium]|nr:hypothetical protein [Oscillospiraceae bacterium]